MAIPLPENKHSSEPTSPIDLSQDPPPLSPAALSAPVSGGRPASLVLDAMAPPLRPPAPVWTPPSILPVTKKLQFLLVAVATVAVALLPVVVMAIAPLWGPPLVRRLVVFVRPPVPEAVVGGEGAGALDVPGVEVWGRKRRVRRVGGVHGVRRMVAHGGRVHGGRHGGVRYG